MCTGERRERFGYIQIPAYKWTADGPAIASGQSASSDVQTFCSGVRTSKLVDGPWPDRRAIFFELSKFLE